MQRKAILLIDADNAPSSTKNVPKVLKTFAAITGYDIAQAFVAANNHANIDPWLSCIQTLHPQARVDSKTTATTKNSADIAILFRMGQLCLEPERLPIFVMSADKLLINAAEQMAELGFFVTILLFDNRLEAMAMKVHRLQLNLEHEFKPALHNRCITNAENKALDSATGIQTYCTKQEAQLNVLTPSTSVIKQILSRLNQAITLFIRLVRA
jgi:hypothetical protein